MSTGSRDIQTLNERALRGELHISAISIHAYAYVSDRYALLPCGASMGDGYGPMIISVDAPGLRSDTEIREWLRGRTIAIPGEMTSAFLALQLCLGEFEFIVVPSRFRPTQRTLSRQRGSAASLRRALLRVGDGQ